MYSKTYPRKPRRHRWARFLIFVLALLLLGLFWWFETFTLTTTECTIEDEAIQTPVTIVQLTDLHGATFGRDNSALLSRVREAAPDLIAVTGDMHSYGDAGEQETAERLLAVLAEEYPVYLVNGEHDRSDSYLDTLRSSGVHVMDYQMEELSIGDTRLTLYGINNVYYSSTFDLANEFTLTPDSYHILLAHMDNFEAFARFGIDLTLCGDTHGGQVRLPFVGAVYNQDVFFPELTQPGSTAARTKGLYQLGDSLLFVSSGLGSHPVPLRLFNRPEIAVIHLEPAA